MKVLSVGIDKDLFKEGSASQVRHKAYAKEVEELHAVVFTRNWKDEKPVQIATNAWVYPARAKTSVGLLWSAYRVSRKILKKEGEWVLSAQDPFESGVVAYLLSHVIKRPFLVQEHGDFFSQTYWRKESLLNEVRYRVGQWVLRRADHVRVVSVRIAKTLESRGVSKERITVVPVYTDLDLFSSEKKVSGVGDSCVSKKNVFLTMARFTAQKNLPMLIRAFKILLGKGVEAKLLMVGKGEEEEKLRALAKDACGDKVEFQAWTDDPAGLLCSATAYVLSSNYEGWGRVCIEALAAGVPLVMTDVGCAGEVVRNEVQGIVVPTGDEQALAEGMYRLLTDDGLRDRFVQEGKRAVTALPTFEENVALYIQSLHICLKTREQTRQNSSDPRS